MSINELESKCRELRQLQSLIDEAQAEADSIRDAIKAAMKSCGARCQRCCGSSPSWYKSRIGGIKVVRLLSLLFL